MVGRCGGPVLAKHTSASARRNRPFELSSGPWNRTSLFLLPSPDGGSFNWPAVSLLSTVSRIEQPGFRLSDSCLLLLLSVFPQLHGLLAVTVDL